MSSPPLRSVRLLGPPRARVGRSWHDFADDKRYHLLGYLACTGDWVGRERLAYLFWPDAPSGVARQRLRQLLKRVRALDWLDPTNAGLEIEDARVRWRVDSDVAAFRTALAASDGERVTELYRGTLLEGVEGDDAPEFAAWLELERATLQSGWRALLLEQAERADDPARPLSLLAALLQRDDLDEEALRAYMTALARNGQRPRALEAYRDFAQRLEEVLAIEPALATQRRAESIRRSAALPPSKTDPLPPPASATPPSAPPATVGGPVGGFVGRDVDLTNVLRLLEQPSCRLLTLMGLGGVGKSRIAWRIVDDWSGEREGEARFIRLEALSSTAAIPSAIADGLGLALQGERDPLEQVARHIGARSLLLVLDNYEHLIEGAPLTGRLLEACPALTLLVTSRERLGVAAEWLYEVTGLGFPAPDVPLERALAYDAVRLFVARTRQVRADYQLNEDDLPHVLEICRRVRGLPLGLELAAAWMRSTPAAAIAEEIRSDVDFLRGRRATERHESIRAVFESSWRLLASEEQRALATLAVFRGGFTRQAAALVAASPTPLLSALVDKSLLELGPGGRYDRHPLLYQYTREKLAERGERDAAGRRHARHFLTVAEEVGGRLRTARDARDIDALEADHDNLRAALDWALEHDPTAALRMAGALGRFWEIRGHLAEGCDRLEAALAAAVDPAPGVAARALGALGRLLFLRGRKGEVEPRLHEALARWRDAGDDQGIASVLNQLGSLAMERGGFDHAEERYREALELCRTHDDRTGVATLLNNLGEVARLQGDAARAQRHYRECLALQRDLDNQRGIAIVLGNLGTLLGVRGEVAEGIALLRESIELKRALGDGIGLAYCFAGLAGVLIEVGEFEPAARLLGATDALIELHSLELDAADRSDHLGAIDRSRDALGAGAFEAAWSAGRGLELGDAVEAALAAGEGALRPRR